MKNRSPGHKDPVTPELRLLVLGRDLHQWELRGGKLRAVSTTAGCVASFLSPITSGPCWGRLTLDHIKDEQRMGVRAPSDPAHLVSLCQGHTEDGARAGHQWNTANRQLLRWYLRSLVERGLVGN
jgi:hypothetical protein